MMATCLLRMCEGISIEREKGAYHSLVLQDGMNDVLPRSNSNLKMNARVDVHVEEKKLKF